VKVCSSKLKQITHKKVITFTIQPQGLSLFSRGILITIFLLQTGNGEVQGLLDGRCASWVGMSVQNILLGDGSEREFNRLNLDFMSLTILAFPHGDSKGEESVREDVMRLDFARGILTEPANRFPRSISKTLYLSLRASTAGCRAVGMRCQTMGGINVR